MILCKTKWRPRKALLGEGARKASVAGDGLDALARDNRIAMAENQTQDPRAEFIEASVWHGSLDRANDILATHPEVASSDVHTAALLGDYEAVARFLVEDPANATIKGA